ASAARLRAPGGSAACLGQCARRRAPVRPSCASAGQRRAVLPAVSIPPSSPQLARRNRRFEDGGPPLSHPPLRSGGHRATGRDTNAGCPSERGRAPEQGAVVLGCRTGRGGLERAGAGAKGPASRGGVTGQTGKATRGGPLFIREGNGSKSGAGKGAPGTTIGR